MSPSLPHAEFWVPSAMQVPPKVQHPAQWSLQSMVPPQPSGIVRHVPAQAVSGSAGVHLPQTPGVPPPQVSPGSVQPPQSSDPPQPFGCGPHCPGWQVVGVQQAPLPSQT
jgi:hypothetical protein